MELITIILLLVVAGSFVGASYRHRRAVEAMERFIADYSALSDDDTVAVEVMENMRAVFVISCRVCASTTILLTFLQYKYNQEYRRRVDARTTLNTKNLQVASARRILNAYASLFDYACYAVPIFGPVIRFLIKKVGLKTTKTTRPGVFIATGNRIVTPLNKWSWSNVA
jgi:hypothetical protein